MDIFNYFFGQVREKRPWFLGFDQLNQDAKDLLAEAWKWHLPEGFIKELPFEWHNFFFLCSLHALSDHTYLQGTSKERPFDVVVEGLRTNFCHKILSWAPELGFSEAEFIHRPILGGFARLRYEYILLLRK